MALVDHPAGLRLLLESRLHQTLGRSDSASVHFDVPSAWLSFHVDVKLIGGVPSLELYDITVRREPHRMSRTIETIEACRRVAEQLGRYVVLSHLDKAPSTQDQQNVLAYVHARKGAWVEVGERVYAIGPSK